MQEIHLKTFADLIVVSDRYRRGDFIYRGIPNVSYELTPGFARIDLRDSKEKPLKGNHRRKTERDLFRKFVLELPSYGIESAVSDWELLALAQHRGLATRLLDWTDNLLVAAFFACWGGPHEESSDGAIYAFETSAIAPLRDEERSPFDLDELVRFRPRHVDSRITAQRGLFTAHPYPFLDLRVMEALQEESLAQFVVPAGSKMELLRRLSAFDINMRSLFPDLGGLASWLTWSLSSRNNTFYHAPASLSKEVLGDSVKNG